MTKVKSFLPKVAMLLHRGVSLWAWLFYSYKYIDRMKRKEAYKKQIGNYGLITMCYLVTYYEDLELYEECSVILEAIKEFCEANNIAKYPTRYTKSAIKWFVDSLTEYNLLPSSNIDFNIKNYAMEVIKCVEKECS